MDAPHLQLFRKDRQSENELRESVLLDQKNTLISTSYIRNGSIWKSSACRKSDWCPETPRLSLHRRWSKRSYSTGLLAEDLSQIYLAPLGPTKEVAESERPATGMWEAQGLMTRIDKNLFRTMWNRRLRSTIALTKEWLQTSLSTSFLNGDLAQKVERSFRRREERGWMPRISIFSEKTGNQETSATGISSGRSTKKLISTSNTQREASETAVLNEKEIGAANRQCLPHKDVEGNTVLLTCESKTSLWHE